MREHSHASEQFLDHLDTLSGLALTLEDRREAYETTVDNIEESGYAKDIDRVFNEVTTLLESVFDVIDALDSLIEYSEMEVPAKKGNDVGYIHIGDWLQDAENGRYTGINSWEEAVIFADRFNDDKLQVIEDKMSVAGTMIQHYEEIIEAYENTDQQFEWIIGTEKEAREQIPTDELGLYEIEPPIYSLLDTEYDSRAAKLNTEV